MIKIVIAGAGAHCTKKGEIWNEFQLQLPF